MARRVPAQNSRAALWVDLVLAARPPGLGGARPGQPRFTWRELPEALGHAGPRGEFCGPSPEAANQAGADSLPPRAPAGPQPREAKSRAPLPRGSLARSSRAVEGLP